MYNCNYVCASLSRCSGIYKQSPHPPYNNTIRESARVLRVNCVCVCACALVRASCFYLLFCLTFLYSSLTVLRLGLVIYGHTYTHTHPSAEVIFARRYADFQAFNTESPPPGLLCAERWCPRSQFAANAIGRAQSLHTVHVCCE